MSITQLQSQIKAKLQEFESIKKVNAHLAETEDQLKRLYGQIEKLDSQLEKELNDINDLENIGIKSLFYKTLGSKEEQLEKERQDYLEVSLKYKEIKKEVELMEFERELLSKKVTQLPAINNQLEALKLRRKNEILSTNRNDKFQKDFLELAHKLDINTALEREIKEAIDEGEKTLQVLITILGHLNQAGSWGQWNSNRSSKYMQRQTIDKAASLLPRARHQLALFTRELKDLGENNIEVKLDPIHFDRFTDFFFDNLISDWIVNQRIIGTINNLEGSKAYIKRILMSLVSEHNQVTTKMKALLKEQDRILLE